MAPRSLPARSEPIVGLPAMDRLAPPPPLDLVADRIEAASLPGDVVVDLHGRGGWIARAAVERDRRAITLESSPLARLLAELVLRPPDLRHLDASFGAVAAAPKRDSSLRLWIGERFATRCATCERPLVLDELAWSAPSEDVPPEPQSRHYRCVVCRGQRGGGEQRSAPPGPADLELAFGDGGSDGEDARRVIRERFPPPDGGESLVDDALALHTPRQLIGLAAILERIEGDLRAANVEAALRLAFLQAILPASRLHQQGGRASMPRLTAGRLRPPGGSWRERNPWLAFEDGYRLVRGFLQRLEGASGPLPARAGADLLALLDGTASVSLRVGTASAYRSLANEARDATRVAGRTGVRLILAQPPIRPSPDRLAFAWLATAWVLGRDAAALLPLDALLGAPPRVPWGWQAAALSRSLEAVEPLLARNGRAILIAEGGGQEPLVAAVLGGVGAGYRLVSARLPEGLQEAGVVELAPPGAVVPPGPRTRANVALPAIAGGPGDPDLVPGRGILAPPERFDARPWSPAEAARTVTETAVEVLKARGEPARTDRLVEEVLVGLDRAGHLRRLLVAGATTRHESAAGAAEAGPSDVSTGPADPSAGPAGPDVAAGADAPDATTHDDTQAAGGDEGGPTADEDQRDVPPDGQSPSRRSPERPATRSDAGSVGTATGLWTLQPADPDPVSGHVERVVGLIADELHRADQRRLVEIEAGRWWLADRRDRDSAAIPLADRVEWAIFSLLSTAGPLTEAGFLERIGGLFSGHDRPDETLVRACLEAYRSRLSGPDQLITGDDLVMRSRERGELLALLATLGHRLGMSTWLDIREHERVVDGQPLADRLDPRERGIHLPLITRAPADALAETDAIWYVRRRITILFSVIWTAMLDEPIVRRGSRIPAADTTVRILVVPPERAELVRHKLERSPILRAAMAVDNWHVLKSHHLRAFAELEAPTLEALEPYLGLDPLVERGGEQLPLFNG